MMTKLIVMMILVTRRSTGKKTIIFELVEIKTKIDEIIAKLSE